MLESKKEDVKPVEIEKNSKNQTINAELSVEKIEETVTIPKSQLDSIMDDIKRLKFAADKSQLHNYDEKNKKNPGRSIRLRMINGKVIVSWSSMDANIVEKNQNGIWKEEQSTTVTYEDKTTEKMDYVIFSRRFVSLPANILSEVKSEDGEDIIYNVITEDGRKYSINSKFIN